MHTDFSGPFLHRAYDQRKCPCYFPTDARVIFPSSDHVVYKDNAPSANECVSLKMRCGQAEGYCSFDCRKPDLKSAALYFTITLWAHYTDSNVCLHRQVYNACYTHRTARVQIKMSGYWKEKGEGTLICLLHVSLRTKLKSTSTAFLNRVLVQIPFYFLH